MTNWFPWEPAWNIWYAADAEKVRREKQKGFFLAFLPESMEEAPPCGRMFLRIPWDTDDFGDKLDILIRDKEKRQRMGRAARAYALTRFRAAVFDKLFQDYARIALSGP